MRAPDHWANEAPVQVRRPETGSPKADRADAPVDVAFAEDEEATRAAQAPARAQEGAAMGAAAERPSGGEEPMDVLTRARAARRSGRFAEAITLYRSIIRDNSVSDPARTTAARDLGPALARAGRLREAVNSFEAFRATYPGHHDINQVLFETADTYEKLGETRHAIQLYRLVAQSGSELGRRAANRLDVLQAVSNQPRSHKKAKAKMAAPAEGDLLNDEPAAPPDPEPATME